MILIALYLGAYLLGSVPFAVLIGKAKGVDILSVGSGNPGMTNVMRALGTKWGIICFVLDVLKGLLPGLAARALVPHSLGVFDAQFIWLTAGLAAIVGHCCSVFLRFKGGKGVSTALGAIIGASPLSALICFSLFGVLLLVTRYMSLASVVGVSCSILCDLLLPNQSIQLLPVVTALSLFVIYRHRANFRRLLDGTEPKFSFKKRETTGEPNTSSSTSV